MPKIHVLTWGDFDAAVNIMAGQIEKSKMSVIYGVPRGGLPIAVALSHRSGLPVAETCPADLSDALIVDDVVETGKTFQEYVIDKRAPFFWCWVNKSPSIAVPAVFFKVCDVAVIAPTAEAPVKSMYQYEPPLTALVRMST